MTTKSQSRILGPISWIEPRGTPKDCRNRPKLVPQEVCNLREVDITDTIVERIHDIDGSDLTLVELHICRNTEVVLVPDQRFQGAERILSLKSKLSNEQQFDNVKY